MNIHPRNELQKIKFVPGKNILQMFSSDASTHRHKLQLYSDKNVSLQKSFDARKIHWKMKTKRFSCNFSFLRIFFNFLQLFFELSANYFKFSKFFFKLQIFFKLLSQTSLLDFFPMKLTDQLMKQWKLFSSVFIQLLYPYQLLMQPFLWL